MPPDYFKNPSARRIINSWIQNYQDSPAEWKANLLANTLDDISIDWSDGDVSGDERGELIN